MALQALQGHPSPDLGTYKSCISILAEHGRPYEIAQLFPQMEMKMIMPDTGIFQSAAKACRAAKSASFAMQFEQMLKAKGLHDKQTMATLVMACVDGEDCAASMALLDSMERQTLAAGAVEMAAVAAMAVRAGEASKALEIFERMKARGFAPDPDMHAQALARASARGFPPPPPPPPAFGTGSLPGSPGRKVPGGDGDLENLFSKINGAFDFGDADDFD